MAYDYEYELETRLQQRLTGIITDLRKSWEEEEILRIQSMEGKIRQHYELVIEQLETQLKLALQLQDKADEQWLQDLEIRNITQLDMITKFEEKCKKLYEIRLLEYAEKTSAQISSYEEKLLEVISLHLYLLFVFVTLKQNVCIFSSQFKMHHVFFVSCFTSLGGKYVSLGKESI